MSSCLTEVYRKEMGSEDGAVLQWNPSNLDTVHISEVTGVSKKLFLGEEKVYILIREVSSFQKGSTVRLPFSKSFLYCLSVPAK